MVPVKSSFDTLGNAELVLEDSPATWEPHLVKKASTGTHVQAAADTMPFAEYPEPGGGDFAHTSNISRLTTNTVLTAALQIACLTMAWSTVKQVQGMCPELSGQWYRG